MRRSALRCVLLVVLAPPCFAIGLVIGGCGTSVREEFLMIRGAQLTPTKGDASAYRPNRAFPGLVGFADQSAGLTQVPEH